MTMPVLYKYFYLTTFWEIKNTCMLQAQSLRGSYSINKLTRKGPMTCCIYYETTDGFGEKYSLKIKSVFLRYWKMLTSNTFLDITAKCSMNI